MLKCESHTTHYSLEYVPSSNVMNDSCCEYGPGEIVTAATEILYV